MRSNQISKIAVNPFGKHHPHTLDLSRNQLTYLDELVFEPLLTNNTLIDVDGKCFFATRHKTSAFMATFCRADVHLYCHKARLIQKKEPTQLTSPLTYFTCFTWTNAENPFNCSSCELYRWLLGLDREYLNNIINFSCADETKLEDLTLEMIGCSDQSDIVQSTSGQ